MWVYTNSPNTPSYITPGKLYKAFHNGACKVVMADDCLPHLVDKHWQHLVNYRWHKLSDYHAKHLEG